MVPRRVVILGAAGRDFHNFLVCFRANPAYRVVAFTATQIPGIEKRSFPQKLAGKLYSRDIPIFPEEELPAIVKKYKADLIHLAYSDLSHQEVMHKASLAGSLGCDFLLLSPASTMLPSRKPVIAVTAVRTGCGKSQTTRYLAEILSRRGKRVVVVRHPMPYGDLARQVCQRFASVRDLEREEATIEEREEYEPLIEKGIVVYAGVDYRKILAAAEREADVILWDGGNNDTPFFRPNLWITLVDPHRPGHEVSYYPGEVNLRMADVVIINKEETARKENIEVVRKNTRLLNRRAVVIDADSAIAVSEPALLRGRRALVVEDGPTLTHGGMAYGAGAIAARRFRAELVDPRPSATGSLREVFARYPHLGAVLPAMGYDRTQVRELETTINSVPCEVVVSGTPIDLRRILRVNKPVVRIRYELRERGKPRLEGVVARFLRARA